MPEPQTCVVSTPDEHLVRLARGGDGLAREELFRRYFETSYRVARRLLGHEEDALDAVQEGFLKALVHLDDFDGRSGFRTWLLRIVQNAAFDQGRRRRRKPALRLADADCPEAAFHEDPALGLRRDDLRRRLDEALNRLSPPIRATFVLHTEGGLSYKEIADCLGIPIGTVMSRIHHAKQKLMSYLDGVDGL